MNAAQVGSIDVDNRCVTPDAGNGPSARTNAVVLPCTALRSRVDNPWPKPADRPSAGCKPCESLVMFRAVILRALTIGLDDQGNTMFTNLSESIWLRRARIQQARSRARHPALLCGRPALYWLGISHPNVRASLQGCYSM